MLSAKEIGILLHIIKHCKRIEFKIQGMNRDDLDTNEDFKEIVCFNIFQIGELIKKLSKEFIEKYPNMPWDDIKGMRDWVGHGYGSINLDQIWRTIHLEIVPLREYCESILDKEQ